MKKIELDCEIIQDLLPLYEENCCSEQSKILVKEHLKECKVCQEKLENFRKEISATMIQEDIDEKIIKKGMRKIKRIKIIGISWLQNALLAWRLMNGRSAPTIQTTNGKMIGKKK